MKGKKPTLYAAIFIIILIGVGATMLLVNAAKNVEEPEYADVDPNDLDADYGH